MLSSENGGNRGLETYQVERGSGRHYGCLYNIHTIPTSAISIISRWIHNTAYTETRKIFSSFFPTEVGRRTPNILWMPEKPPPTKSRKSYERDERDRKYFLRLRGGLHAEAERRVRLLVAERMTGWSKSALPIRAGIYNNLLQPSAPS